MKQRFNLAEVDPNAIKAMYGLEGYIKSTGLQKIHTHLIKVRASLINGCAYCIDMHTKEALKDGETQQRLFLVGAWRETNLFTDEEKVLLKMTEEITLINQGGLSDETYSAAQKYFDAKYIAAVLMAVVAINSWNRIVISSHLQIA